MPDLSQVLPCVAALLDYQQADEEGVMVLASRQAIHETVQHFSATRDANFKWSEKCKAMFEAKQAAESQIAEKDARIAELEAALRPFAVWPAHLNQAGLADACHTAMAVLPQPDCETCGGSRWVGDTASRPCPDCTARKP